MMHFLKHCIKVADGKFPKYLLEGHLRKDVSCLEEVLGVVVRDSSGGDKVATTHTLNSKFLKSLKLIWHFRVVLQVIVISWYMFVCCTYILCSW